MQKLLNEINSLPSSSYPPKIKATELRIDHFYKIVELVFINSPYRVGLKSVVARIEVEEVTRSFFLPDIIGDKFTAAYKKGSDINIHETYLVLRGFLKAEKQQCPIIKFEYTGNVQLEMQKLLDEINGLPPTPYPSKIKATELWIDHFYKIVDFVFVNSPFRVGLKSVVVRIEVGKEIRSFFLPDIIDDKFTAAYKEGSDINTHEMYLVLKGFLKAEKNHCPIIKIESMGNAQLQ